MPQAPARSAPLSCRGFRVVIAVLRGRGRGRSGLRCRGMRACRGGRPGRGAAGTRRSGRACPGAGEADLEALDLAEPALASGLGDAVVQVVPDLLETVPLGGVRP